MLRISKLADYAIIVMSYMGAQTLTSFSALQLATANHIALPTVRKLLKLLLKAELLSSNRGASGGYCLTRAAVMITLMDVIEAVDGNFALTECNDPIKQCAKGKCCHVKTNWQVINGAIKKILASINIAQMQSKLTIKS